MMQMEDPTQTTCHNLFEFFTLDEIFQPIRNASRIKYTCFDVSSGFLVLGATSGSLYVFLRSNLQYLKVIPNKEAGSVNLVSISPNELYVAFSTVKGTIVVLEHNSDDGSRVRGWSSGAPRLLQIPQDHRGATVTALQWNTASNRLFVANDKGSVTAMNVASKKAQTLFQVQSSATIVRLSSRIVQLDFACEKLLISTLTGCYICDTAKEQYSQIGSKPRDGEFGACFFTNDSSRSQILYAARPGSRLWEIDFEGSVLCTRQFKNAFSKPLEPYVSINEPFVTSNLTKGSPQSLNFPKLLVICDSFLITWVKERLFILNMSSMEVLLWTVFPDEILDVKVCSTELYVRHGDGRLRCFNLLKVERGLNRLLIDSNWELSASVCIYYGTHILAAKARSWVTKEMLQELAINLQNNGRDDLAHQISELVPRIQEHPGLECVSQKDSFRNYRLESGIYVVNNKPRNGQLVTKNLYRNNGPLEGHVSCRSNGPKNGESTSLELDRERGDSFVDGASVVRRSNGDESSEVSCASSNEVPLYMTYSNAASWDVDPYYGYMALSVLKPNVSLGEIKNSLSSTYKSGKKRILNTMGILEDRLKLIGTEECLEPFDVQVNGIGSRSFEQHSDAIQHHEEESIVFPKKTTDRQYFEAMAFTKQHYAPEVNVDVEPLLKATHKTWERVQNPVILCNVTQLKEILNEWVDILHSTQESWYRELSKSSLESRTKDCQCIKPAAKLEHSKSLSVLSQDIEASTESQRQSCPSLCDTFTRTSCNNDDDVSKERTETVCSESDSGVSTEVGEQISSLEWCGTSGCEPDPRLSQFTLEDVLWWQDAKFVRLTKSKVIKNVTSVNSCWLCNAKFIVGNPWQLADFNKQTVKKLVTMCWKTKTFGRLTKYCQSFTNWTQFESLDSDESSPVSWAADVDRLLRVTSKEELVYDHARSIFVRQYFGLLKPEDAFRDVQLDKRWSCRTFESILNGLLFATNCQSSNLARGLCYDEQPTNPFLAILRSETRDASLITEKIMDSFERVSCRDVLYMDQILDCRPSLFLTYMDVYSLSKLSSEGQHVQKKFDLESIGKLDTTVRLIWVQLMLENGPVPSKKSVQCSICGKPKPFSHLHPWKWQERLLAVLKNSSANDQLYLQLCKERFFWIGLVQLYHLVGSRNEMFHLMVQLGDIALFRDRDNIHMLPQTIIEWQFLLELIITHDDNCGADFCIECKMNPYVDRNKPREERSRSQTQLTVEAISRLMLRYCDINLVVRLLEKLVNSHPTISFSSDFYRKCIADGAIRQQQRVLVYNALEKADAYVWSRRKNYASPEVRYRLLSKHTNDVVGIQKCRFLEDLHCHWGVAFDLQSSCSVCSCPLVLPSSLMPPSGIRIFPCGHGYHRSCLLDKLCPTCSRQTEF